MTKTTEEKCFALTAAFEGGGYTALAGNFDGQGISFGVIQFNLGRGTLQPLLLAMYRLHPAAFARCCTVAVQGRTQDVTSSLLELIGLSPTQGVAWAKARQDAGGRFRPEYTHWVTIFRHLGTEPEFQAVQRAKAEPYMVTARGIVARYGWRSERALALAFDIAVQMGSVGPGARLRYARASRGLGELAQLAAMAKAIAPQGGRWARDVLSRKLAIALGAGVVHGRSHHLERDFGITTGPVVR